MTGGQLIVECLVQNGVEVIFGAVVESDQSSHERSNVFMPRADMIRNGALRVAVVLADKAAVLAEAELHETLVPDYNALQAKKLLLVERCASSFANGAAPSLNSILRRPFSFYHIARLRVLQQKEGGGAGKQILRYLAHDSARALSSPAR